VSKDPGSPSPRLRRRFWLLAVPAGLLSLLLILGPHGDLLHTLILIAAVAAVPAVLLAAAARDWLRGEKRHRDDQGEPGA
jgi:hypothetical protein